MGMIIGCVLIGILLLSVAVLGFFLWLTKGFTDHPL